MAAVSVQNPVVASESKSAKKKKAKAAARTESPAPPASSTSDKALSANGNDNTVDDPSDSHFVRELQKTIRNTSKKLMNAAKIDAIVAEHPGKSLDVLVGQKIINSDQKAAHLKKPSLQAQLFHLEEQLSQTKKMEADFRARFADQEQKSAKEKLLLAAEIKEKAVAEAVAEAKTELEANLLVLTQFLRIAAARRMENTSPELDENRALEGILLSVYSGDENAVASMLKLVHGSDEPTHATNGDTLQTTYRQVKKIATTFQLLPYGHNPPQPNESENEPKTDPSQIDPSAADETLAESDDSTAVATTIDQGVELPADVPNGQPAASTDVADSAADSAANAAGASPSDMSAADMTASQEWVKVPHDPNETENGLQATPAAPSGTTTQSWADDHPDPVEESSSTAPAAVESGDGFSRVQRGRGGGSGSGSYNNNNSPRESNNGWRGGRGGNGEYRGGNRGRGGGYRGGDRGGGEGGRGRGRPRGRGGSNGGPRRGGEQES